MSEAKVVKITDELLEKIAADFAELPEKPGARERTTREAIHRLKPQLAAMREKGYSIEDRAAALGRFGIAIKPSTLKGYERSSKKPAAKKVKAPASEASAQA